MSASTPMFTTDAAGTYLLCHHCHKISLDPDSIKNRTCHFCMRDLNPVALVEEEQQKVEQESEQESEPIIEQPPAADENLNDNDAGAGADEPAQP